ncbi:hypothetical protein PS6_002028 [Mucor atramentarius]
MKFSVIIAGLFSAMVVKAAVYEINFATNADALDCQARDIKYINKVSDSHVTVTLLSSSNSMLSAPLSSPEAALKRYMPNSHADITT